MKTIETKVYQFSELSDKAKEKALNNLRYNQVESGWWEYTHQDALSIGLKIQSFDLDRNRHCKGEFILSACEVAQNIFNEHGESCETYKTAKSFIEDWQPIFNDYMNETSENYESRELEEQMQELETEFCNSLCEDYSILLEKEYEYLTSDEATIKSIEANEYEFYENGELF